MNLQNKLLNFLDNPKYTPLTFDKIGEALKLSKSESKEAKTILTHLVEEGLLAIIKQGCYVIAQEADLLSGIIKFKPSGNAMLIPDHPLGTPEPEPILILAKDTDVSLHNDHVLARIVKERPKARYKKGKRLPPLEPGEVHAQVKKVLRRHYNTLIGTLKKTSTHYFLLPDDPKITQDIIIDDPNELNLPVQPKLGQKVIVELKDWIHPHLSPEGVIIDILGETHTALAEYKAILHKYNLSPEFNDRVKLEAGQICPKVQQKELQNRLDCRQLFTLTIDPDDAQDFDDAISIEDLPSGDTRVGIHIADVSYYVHQNNEIDKEAQKRGNSTYLIGTVIPMLPFTLSNGICSLVEDEDRLTKTVFVTFNSQGKIKETSFANSVIRSNKRLTYHQAYAFLIEDDLKKIREMPPPPSYETGATGRPLKDFCEVILKQLQISIRKLWQFASVIRHQRMKKGSLDLDMPEVRIFVDANGYADHIETILYDESHQLIEEYMLLANQIVAKTLLESNMPFISRVHDKPDSEKLNELREILITFDIHTGDLTNRSNVIKLLNKIKSHPQGYTLKVQFLRSLKQACYRASSDGHYGLNMEHYAHFTSPIRRYADLIVHRIFDNYLTKHGYETAMKTLHKPYSQGQLQHLAQHISITEQNSTEAERESSKIKLLEFFERELAQPKKSTFTAIITDVRNFGLFIELTESMAFGLLPFSLLKDDIYYLNTENTKAIGRRHRKTFSIGQEIKVSVNKVDRFKRQIDFELADNKPKPSDNKPTDTKPQKPRNRRNFKKPKPQK